MSIQMNHPLTKEKILAGHIRRDDVLSAVAGLREDLAGAPFVSPYHLTLVDKWFPAFKDSHSSDSGNSNQRDTAAVDEVGALQGNNSPSVEEKDGNSHSRTAAVQTDKCQGQQQSEPTVQNERSDGRDGDSREQTGTSLSLQPYFEDRKLAGGDGASRCGDSTGEKSVAGEIPTKRNVIGSSASQWNKQFPPSVAAGRPLSQCPSCLCMTYTVEARGRSICGKCAASKDVAPETAKPLTEEVKQEMIRSVYKLDIQHLKEDGKNG